MCRLLLFIVVLPLRIPNTETALQPSTNFCCFSLKSAYVEYLDGPYLFDSMYAEDPEASKLMYLPGVTALLETYPSCFRTEWGLRFENMIWGSPLVSRGLVSHFKQQQKANPAMLRGRNFKICVKVASPGATKPKHSLLFHAPDRFSSVGICGKWIMSGGFQADFILFSMYFKSKKLPQNLLCTVLSDLRTPPPNFSQGIPET